MPLPAGYGIDLIILQVRDPQTLYAYWELKPSTVAQGRKKLGEEGAHAEPTLRVFENNTYLFDIQLSPHATDWFIEGLHPHQRFRAAAASGRRTTYPSWRAAIGLKGRSGTFVILARSNTVETPPLGESAPTQGISSAGNSIR